MINEKGLEIGDHDGEATNHWTREGLELWSGFDLTLAIRPITKWFIPADDHATGSDYEVIQWEVEVDRQEEAGQRRVVWGNLAAMTEEKAKAAEKLWPEDAKGRAHLDEECTADEMKQGATWIQEAMDHGLDNMANKIRIPHTGRTKVLATRITVIC